MAARHSVGCVRIWRACWPLSLSTLASATSAAGRRTRIAASAWRSPARAGCIGSVRVAFLQDAFFDVAVATDGRETRLCRVRKLQVLYADRVRLLAASAASGWWCGRMHSCCMFTATIAVWWQAAHSVRARQLGVRAGGLLLGELCTHTTQVFACEM